MTTPRLTYCQVASCARFWGPMFGPPEDPVFACEAFPKGIPEEIMSGNNKHTESVDGDNGLTYEPLENVGVKGSARSGNWGHTGLDDEWGGSDPGGGLEALGLPPDASAEERRRAAEIIKKAREQGVPIAASGPVEEDGNAHAVLNNGLADVVRNSPLDLWGAAAVHKWERAYLDTRQAVKDHLVTLIAQEIELSDYANVSFDKKYEIVNKIIKQWAHSANDEDARSLSIQQDAAEVFGVELSDWQKGKVKEISASGEEIGLVGLYPSEWQREILATMYKITQDRFAELGFDPDDTVRLYRGTNIPMKDMEGWDPGEVVKYEGNALESWSVSQDSANVFADPIDIPMDGEDTYGVILEIEVPVKNVVGTARTGFGCLGEGEFVIKGCSVDGATARVAARGGIDLDYVSEGPHGHLYLDKYKPPEGTTASFEHGIAAPGVGGVGMWWYDPGTQPVGVGAMSRQELGDWLSQAEQETDFTIPQGEPLTEDDIETLGEWLAGKEKES